MEISLAQLRDLHIIRIFSLWKILSAADAGLTAVGDQPGWSEAYRIGLQELDSAFQERAVIIGSRDWIALNGVRDLLSQLLVTMEELRKFCHLVEISRAGLPEDEVRESVRQSTNRPDSPKACLEDLHGRLQGGFRFGEELKSLELLLTLLMKRIAGEELTETITLTLFRPAHAAGDVPPSDVLGSGPSSAPKSLTSVSRMTLTITRHADLEMGRELLHQVFLTAIILVMEVCLEIERTYGGAPSLVTP